MLVASWLFYRAERGKRDLPHERDELRPARLKRPTLIAFAFASGKNPFALYSDAAGAPGALLDQSGSIGINAGPAQAGFKVKF